MSDLPIVTTETLGTEEVKAVILAGLRVAELVDALSDGIGLGDIGALLRAAKTVKPAMEAIKSGRLVPAIKDLDQTEKDDVKAFIAAELDLKDDAVEAAIEKGLGVVVDLADLLKVIG